MFVGRSVRVANHPKSASVFRNMMKHMKFKSKLVYVFQIVEYLVFNRFQFLNVIFEIVARHPQTARAAWFKYQIVNQVQIRCMNRCKLWFKWVSSCTVYKGCYEWKDNVNSTVANTFRHNLHTSRFVKLLSCPGFLAEEKSTQRSNNIYSFLNLACKVFVAFYSVNL